MLKRIATLIVAAIFALTLMAPAAFATHRGPEHGNQTQENTACVSSGSGQETGQSPDCRGQGVVQETQTVNQGGNAPKGQNK